MTTDKYLQVMNERAAERQPLIDAMNAVKSDEARGASYRALLDYDYQTKKFSLCDCGQCKFCSIH